MTLYAVTIEHVHPTQCVVVWDRKESADLLAAHLCEVVSDHARVVEVDSFFPSGMCDADKAWLDATDAYLRGDHHNTTE